MSGDSNPINVLPLACSIVAAYLSKTKVPPHELASLLCSVRDTLVCLARGDVPGGTPAVPIAQSVNSNYLVCLENGLKLKLLKRHLREVHGLSPEQYRTRWALPADYPMVPAGYSRVRSSLAKKIGLGTQATRAQPARAKRAARKTSAQGKRDAPR